VKNLITRTITGVLLVAAILGAIFVSKLVFAALFFPVCALALWEFYTILQSYSNPQKYPGLAAGLIVYTVLSLYAFGMAGPKWLAMLIPVIFFLFIFELFSKNPRPIDNLALTFLGIIYIALPLSLLNFFFASPFVDQSGLPTLPAGVFIITWLSDTGAYLVGKQFGRYKLYDRISPKKTWEGVAGGVVVAYLCGYGMTFFDQVLNLFHWMVVTTLIIIFGTLGDLIESKFKRSLDLKDSGNLLPGHGGMLDRFDTIFLSIPFIYFYILIFH